MAQHKVLGIGLALLLIASPVFAAKKKMSQDPGLPSIDMLLVKRNYKSAFNMMLVEAQGGKMASIMKLANAYRLGLGTSRDEETALKWYKIAAGAGNKQAQTIISHLNAPLPATEKKMVLKSGVSDAPATDGVDFAHLPKRVDGQPGWAVIAAAHKNKAALAALKTESVADALLVSAKLNDVEAIAAQPEKAAFDGVDELGRSALVSAVAAGKAETIEALLNKPIDFSKPDKMGMTAAGIAAQNCQPEILAKLVKAGAKLEVKGEAEPALVSVAATCADWSKFKEIFAKQNMNVQDSRGRTAAWYAAARGDVSLLGWLVDQGADLTLADQQGFGPLHSAALSGQALALRFILSKTDKIDAVSSRGVTGLMLASFKGCTECVSALLDKKAVLDQKDQDGDTALMFAVRGLQGSLAQKLTESGANPNLKNNAADTPLKLGTRLGLLTSSQ